MSSMKYIEDAWDAIKYVRTPLAYFAYSLASVTVLAGATVPFLPASQRLEAVISAMVLFGLNLLAVVALLLYRPAVLLLTGKDLALALGYLGDPKHPQTIRDWMRARSQTPDGDQSP